MEKPIKSGTCYCFSLLEIIISILSSQTNIKIDENNVQSYLNPNCDIVFNYIDSKYLLLFSSAHGTFYGCLWI